MILLRADHLKKTYKKIKAVDGVSFHIHTGEIFGLLGENGAGKTTVIKMLSTLTKPDSGSAKMLGVNIFTNNFFAREQIAIVPQEINLDNELCVQDNLYIYAKLHKVENAKKRVADVLSQFGIAEKAKERVSDLSGGQKRRVMLTRVMLGDPKLIFMDEPTIGLDPSIRKDIWQMIRHIKESGKSVLLTTHYTDEAEQLCGRVALMQKGKLVKTGSPAKLVEQAGSLAVDMALGRAQVTKMFPSDAELIQYVKKHNINDYSIHKPRLEDVLLDMKEDCP
ncbi:ABC transporter related protein [Denitrovibrio acetiphilus DSM 12809]|uniref:ABC transporter related protein n=1 Tax=Denitrovibrio acetiphilus (strain DSM 12809 / NBRC 114555 / N2460) TaxID=522772 RepID=D4H5H8_DENA2|nr:ABC transporter ATP-binding protein [Denitrovibrio acetiphilus]ADD67598.1 ABC transporter related protein [Denitrovibrio acetiphilus DSM 12809]